MGVCVCEGWGKNFCEETFRKNKGRWIFFLRKSYITLPFFMPYCFLMEYELFRPVIIHMVAAWNLSYGFVKRCFITSIIYFEQLQK